MSAEHTATAPTDESLFGSVANDAAAAPGRGAPDLGVDLDDVPPGGYVQDVFCIADRKVKKAKSGDSEYLQITLVNMRGQRITSNIWKDAWPKWEGYEAGMAIRVEAMREEKFPSLKIKAFESVPGDHPVTLRMNPVYDGDVAVLDAEFAAFVARIRHPGIRRFVEIYFGPDSVPYEKFRTCPAAKGNHHAYLHGLLEHTLEVTRGAVAIAEMPVIRDNVNLDLVIASALLHDSGKVREYVWEGQPIGMSPWAGMTNHMATGPQLTCVAHEMHRTELAELGFTDELRYHIEHVILAHHGEPEWGAVVKPKTITAQIVHQADMASAHVRHMIEVMRSARPDEYGRVDGGYAYRHGLMLDPANYDGPEIATPGVGVDSPAMAAKRARRAARRGQGGENGGGEGAAVGTSGESAESVGAAAGARVESATLARLTADGYRELLPGEVVAEPDRPSMRDEARQVNGAVHTGTLAEALSAVAPRRGARAAGAARSPRS